MLHRETHRRKLFPAWIMVAVTIFIILEIVIPTESVYAFNGKRKGFILGGGAGAAYATVYNDNQWRPRTEAIGAQTAFIIGAGVSDKVTISYTGLQFWGNAELFWKQNDSKRVGFALLPSAEVRYFASKEAPSVFGALGFGLALYDDDTDEWGLGAGFSPHLGFGYEFARHYSAEIVAIYGAPQIGYDPLFNIAIVFTALAY